MGFQFLAYQNRCLAREISGQSCLEVPNGSPLHWAVSNAVRKLCQAFLACRLDKGGRLLPVGFLIGCAFARFSCYDFDWTRLDHAKPLAKEGSAEVLSEVRMYNVHDGMCNSVTNSSALSNRAALGSPVGSAKRPRHWLTRCPIFIQSALAGFWF
ncbi:hypothetical protein VTK26DRAFT_4969 [Humicola hyalothermophila]